MSKKGKINRKKLSEIKDPLTGEYFLPTHGNQKFKTPENRIVFNQKKYFENLKKSDASKASTDNKVKNSNPFYFKMPDSFGYQAKLSDSLIPVIIGGIIIGAMFYFDYVSRKRQVNL